MSEQGPTRELCLTKAQVRAFVRGALPRGEWVAAREHIDACERCSREMSWALTESMSGSLGHLSYEELESLARDESAATTSEHLAACSGCRGRLDDIRRWQQEPDAPVRVTRPRLVRRLALATVAAGLLLAVGWWMKPDDDPPLHRLPVPGGQIVVGRTSIRWEAPDPPRSDVLLALFDVLRGHDPWMGAPLPDSIAWARIAQAQTAVSGSRSATGSEAPGRTSAPPEGWSIEAVAPRQALRYGRATLTWQPDAGAGPFSVAVTQCGATEPTWADEGLEGCSVLVGRVLPAGVYSWAVRGRHGRSRPAWFRVLSSDETVRLSADEATYRDQPLVLAVIYERLDMYEESALCYARAAEDHPDVPELDAGRRRVAELAGTGAQ